MLDLNRVYNRVLAAHATGVRGDLSIADFQKFDRSTAHVLMEYEPSLGRPRGEDIERYFHKFFDSKVTPDMVTCSIKTNSVSLIVHLNQPMRPIEDASDSKKMTAVVANMMYLDAELGDHWEVTQDQDGKKVLARIVREDIDQIIAAKRNRMFVTKTPSVSLASVSIAKDLLAPGMTVRAYHKGKMVEAKIQERLKGGFRLSDGSKEFVVAGEQVMDLMQEAAEKGKKGGWSLEEYFAKAYGDKDYAKQLVKKS